MASTMSVLAKEENENFHHKIDKTHLPIQQSPQEETENRLSQGIQRLMEVMNNNQTQGQENQGKQILERNRNLHSSSHAEKSKTRIHLE